MSVPDASIEDVVEIQPPVNPACTIIRSYQGINKRSALRFWINGRKLNEQIRIFDRSKESIPLITHEDVSHLLPPLDMVVVLRHLVAAWRVGISESNGESR